MNRTLADVARVLPRSRRHRADDAERVEVSPRLGQVGQVRSGSRVHRVAQSDSKPTGSDQATTVQTDRPTRPTMINDFRYALRWLRRSPGFAAVAILSLGLGIGVNTAMFSLVDAVLLRPLPVAHPDTLVDVFTSSGDGDEYATSSYPDFLDLKAQNTRLQRHARLQPDVCAAQSRRSRAAGDGSRRDVESFRDARRARRFSGACCGRSDDEPGAERVVVIAHGMWQRDFGGDRRRRRPRAAPARSRLHHRRRRARRRSPVSFRCSRPKLWLPVAHVEEVEPAGINDNVPSPTGRTRLERRGSRWLFVKGRLKPGVTAAQAHANVSLIGAQLAAAYPVTNKSATHVGVSDQRRAAPGAAGQWSALDRIGGGDGGRRSRAAHCLRQRRRHAARARVGAAPRDQHPARDRRRAAASSSGRCSSRGWCLVSAARAVAVGAGVGAHPACAWRDSAADSRVASDSICASICA